MKTLLSCLFVLLILTSCEKVIEIQPPTLKGTVWTKPDNVQNGIIIYKTIEFNDSTVDINYKYDKKKLYTDIGVFDYVYEGNRVWVKNPDNSVVIGEIIENEFHFGGEILTKEL